MLRKLIKRFASEKQLEKIVRTKQFLKDAGLLQPGLRIMPPSSFRVGNEVIQVSPASSLTLSGWRKLLRFYKMASPREKDEFRMQARAMLLANTSSFVLLETAYVKEIFKDFEAMYFEFLGIAYYAAGEPGKALDSFRQLQAIEPGEKTSLCIARCLIQVEDGDRVITFLQRALQDWPDSGPLGLTLANALFRAGQVSQANEVLRSIKPDVFSRVQNLAHNREQLEEEVKEALAQKTIVRPAEKLGFQKYTEESVQDYWETLFYHFTAKTRFQNGWSDLCYITEKKISDYLDKYGDIKTVVNFGVFCAVPDYRLALKYPDKNFVGIDRELKTKQLNDAAFAATNISFHALDLVDIIYEDRYEVKNFLALEREKGEIVVFHARTTTLIYPEAVKQLYKACAKQKIKYIALYENMALSRTHMQYFDFDTMPADAIPYFSVMMIHNYKKYLEEAGYEIVEKELWGYSELLWEGKDLYGVENWMALGDNHICLLAKLK